MGILLMRWPLKTAQLPFIELENPGAVIGTNTVESMKSGLIYGTAAMMDGMAQRIEEELGQKATPCCNGGRVPPLPPTAKGIISFNSNLLFRGTQYYLIIKHNDPLISGLSADKSTCVLKSILALLTDARGRQCVHRLTLSNRSYLPDIKHFCKAIFQQAN